MIKDFTQPSLLSKLISFIKEVVGYESNKKSDVNLHIRIKSSKLETISNSIKGNSGAGLGQLSTSKSKTSLSQDSKDTNGQGNNPHSMNL